MQHAPDETTATVDASVKAVNVVILVADDGPALGRQRTRDPGATPETPAH